MNPDRDLTPLADRLAVLQATRALAALAVLGIPALTGSTPPDLIPLAAGYIGVTAVVEFLRRRARLRTPVLVTAMLLLDGVFLAVAVALTGGARSPLLFLMFLDVLAVTLLASYRSGLKVAVWNALLLFLGQAAVRTGVLDAAQPASDREAALSAAAFLVVAVSAAVFSALNERALRDSRAQLAGLVELSADLGRVSSPNEVGDALASHLVTRAGFRRAVVVTSTADGWVHAFAGAEGSATTRACDVPSGTDVSDPGPDNEPRLVRALDPQGSLASLLPGAVNVAVVPLYADNSLLGVVAAEWGASRQRIPASIAAVLTQACAGATLAFRNRSLLDEVERLAAGDPLTGLANRRVLENALDREVQRSHRTGEPLALVMLDVDHFKTINDTLGHQAGDEVLRGIASALAANSKGFDLTARLGGDEFAVVLPGCVPSAAPRVAERLRAAAASTIPGAGGLSAGVAVLPDDAQDAHGLVAAADAALYAAKRAGRAQAQPARAVVRT